MSRHFGMLWILVTVTLTPAAYAAQARNLRTSPTRHCDRMARDSLACVRT
jgi:hypothetical protein